MLLGITPAFIQKATRYIRMKWMIIGIMVSLIPGFSQGQDSINVTRKFENDRPVTRIDSTLNAIPNVIFLDLNEGFDDSIRVSVDGELIFSGYLKTNFSIGLARSFTISFRDPRECKILKVEFVNANSYILEQLNLNYKSLGIGKYYSWFLTYSNCFPMRE